RDADGHARPPADDDEGGRHGARRHRNLALPLPRQRSHRGGDVGVLPGFLGSLAYVVSPRAMATALPAAARSSVPLLTASGDGRWPTRRAASRPAAKPRRRIGGSRCGRPREAAVRTFRPRKNSCIVGRRLSTGQSALRARSTAGGPLMPATTFMAPLTRPAAAVAARPR